MRLSVLAPLLVVVGSRWSEPAAALSSISTPPPARPPPRTVAADRPSALLGHGTTSSLWTTTSPTRDVSTVLNNNPSMEAFRRGTVPLVCLPHAIDDDATQRLAWKHDALALRSLAFGTSAGVVTGHAGIRTGVHQVWLESLNGGCGSASSNPLRMLVGNVDARRELLWWVDGLRRWLECDQHIPSLPTELVELSYLMYESNGAAYAKHVDAFANKDTDRQRTISFLLYLGSSVDDEEELLGAWDCKRDSGALRIHGREFAQAAGQPVQTDANGEVWSDIAPEPGTLVLFDSARVPHEVVATHRGRICVVGWLGTYNNHRGEPDTHGNP